MRNLIFLLLLSFLISINASAQAVSILTPGGNRAFEAMAWANDGRIITCDYISGWVFGIRRDGGLDTLLSNRVGPLGGTFDPAGNYYYSEFGTGSLRRYTPDGRDSVLATNLGQPTGTYYDAETDRVLVADYTYNRLHAYSLVDGGVEILIDSTSVTGVNGPDGIAPGPDGGYLIANFNDNRIHRLDTNGNVSLFSSLPGSVRSGYLIPFKDGYLSAGLADHRIWFLTAEGGATVWAGNGMQAFINGSRLDTVAFSMPNGLALSPDGDSLVISENTTLGQIRLITGLNSLTSTMGRENPAFSNLTVYPQPARDVVTTAFQLPDSGNIHAELLSASGQRLRTYPARQLPAGDQQLSWSLPDTLKTGPYFLRLWNDGGGQQTLKVLIE